MNVKELFTDFLSVTNDPVAASNLVIAQAIIGDGKPAGATLDVKQAAAFLGVSLGTVYSLCNQEKIRHSRIGRLYRFKPEDLDEYAGDQKQESLNRPLKHLKLGPRPARRGPAAMLA